MLEAIVSGRRRALTGETGPSGNPPEALYLRFATLVQMFGVSISITTGWTTHQVRTLLLCERRPSGARMQNDPVESADQRILLLIIPIGAVADRWCKVRRLSSRSPRINLDDNFRLVSILPGHMNRGIAHWRVE